MDTLHSRASNTCYLEKRIAYNANNQTLDLNSWIFDNVVLPPDSKVLELCAGTGNQTLEFAKRLNSEGRVVALDISKHSLELIENKLPESKRNIVHTVFKSMDNLAELEGDYSKGYFDICFCAYGLYYTQDLQKTLRSVRKLLKTGGRIIIVGPFGKNNSNLFQFLQERGVQIPPVVTHSSQDFLYEKVMPWALKYCKKMTITTAENAVRWNRPEDLVDYWKCSTFFDSELLPSVEEGAIEYFKKNEYFVVNKHIAMIDMYLI